MTADSAVETWSRYVAAAKRDADQLADGVRALPAEGGRDALAGLAALAFRLGLSSVLVGAEDVGRLALGVERACDAARTASSPAAEVRALLEAPASALAAALAQLAAPDKSGARVEGLPLAQLLRSLEEGRSPAAIAAPPISPPQASSPPASARAASAPPVAPDDARAMVFHWAPPVDDDMIELFFEEAQERVEGIAGKLLSIEERPDDLELLRDLFRDLHTVKGSSAMVGLAPVNELAHAAEDLVGQLREGARRADAPVVNALLAALDGLRALLATARDRKPLPASAPRVVRALRDPYAAASPAADAPAPASATSASAAQAAAHEAAPAAGAKAAATAAPAAKQTIRVDFDKLDRLLNLVGELVLGRESLRGAGAALASVTGELSTDRALARRIATLHGRADASGRPGKGPDPRVGLQDLTEELGRVERVLSSIAGSLDASTSNLESVSSLLRDQVMRLRMVPVGGVLRKHQRTVRDLAQSLGKKVRIELVGEDTELDKLLVEALDEPLLHLVRNAVDHGIEVPAERAAAGKPVDATIRLEAMHRGNQVVIRVADDGKGIDPKRLKSKALEKSIASSAELDTMDDRAALELVFRAGFSTAGAVTDVSGRGVGMDIVRQTIVARLKGTIDIESSLGRGTAFVLKLPLTLAIIQVMLARASGETFAIPLDAAERTVVIPADEVRLVADREVIEVDGMTVPIVRLAHVLALEGPEPGPDDPLHVVLTAQHGALFGLACDQLIGKKEIVVKSLGEVLSGVPCAVGATILGDRCALILDVPAIVQRALSAAAPARRARASLPSSARSRGDILLVDDSDTVRESLRRLLVEAGFAVTTAEDGRAGLALAASRRFDLVSTDVMMPHMDGYELTRALRALPAYREVPIVMVTSRGELIDRVRGFDAGVDEYITKPHDRRLLLQAVEKLLGQKRGQESP